MLVISIQSVFITRFVNVMERFVLGVIGCSFQNKTVVGVVNFAVMTPQQLDDRSYPELFFKYWFTSRIEAATLWR